jgi:diguanylate cyclase (GGDEF)-like protein
VQGNRRWPVSVNEEGFKSPVMTAEHEDGRRSVLVVDDEPQIVDDITEFLREQGYRVFPAYNGEEAYNVYLQEHPRIVLTDIKMPGMNGMDLLRQIKAQDRQNAEVIMFSGHMDIDDTIESLRYGASRYIKKPISLRELATVLGESVEKLRVIDEGKELVKTLETMVSERDSRIKGTQEFMQSVIDAVTEPVMVIGPDYKVKLMNKSARVISDGHACEQNPSCYQVFRHREKPCSGVESPCPMEAIRTMRRQVSTVHEYQGQNGESRYAEIIASPLWAKDGKLEAVVEIMRDITEQRQAEDTLRENKARLEHVTRHDTLTGLPNRLFLNERMEHILEQAKRKGQQVAVLFIDLDHFKTINDVMGHSLGDLVLQGVSERLTGCIRKSDTIARQGGDEFIIVLPHCNREKGAVRVAQKISEVLESPIHRNNREFYVTASIGIAIYPDDGGDAQTLLSNADIALHRAKEQGRNTYQFYNPEMNARALERMELKNLMHKALERQEFLLHYQPQVDGGTGRIVGMEALVRWQLPGRGLVSPAEFIPIAEQTGLIVPIGEWVLRTACAQNVAWQRSDLRPVRIAVNLSALQLKEQNLAGKVDGILKETGMEPGWLELEITESTIMHDIERAVSTLCDLHNLGVKITVDDFGTGYSSLYYLKKFALYALKIDRSFVNEITHNQDDAAIATAIVAMAHSLKLKVVAEGVETEEQLEMLRFLGCDLLQGFLFSKPLPAEEATVLLENQPSG